MESLIFNKMRLSEELEIMLETAVNLINKVTGKDFKPSKQLFRKRIACIFEGVIFILVSTHSRPGKSSVVALSPGSKQSILLPDQLIDDFEECCRLIKADTDDKINMLKSFIKGREMG